MALCIPPCGIFLGLLTRKDCCCSVGLGIVVICFVSHAFWLASSYYFGVISDWHHWTLGSFSAASYVYPNPPVFTDCPCGVGFLSSPRPQFLARISLAKLQTRRMSSHTLIQDRTLDTLVPQVSVGWQWQTCDFLALWLFPDRHIVPSSSLSISAPAGHGAEQLWVFASFPLFASFPSLGGACSFSLIYTPSSPYFPLNSPNMESSVWDILLVTTSTWTFRHLS